MQEIQHFKASQTTGFFITGTDTDVGKTHVAATIATLLSQQGLKVAPRKPIASGCIKQADGSLFNSDAERLKTGAQSNESIATISPYQFIPAVSPQTALEMAGKIVTTDDLVTACAVPNGHFQLVEGAGGFFSPLCSNGLNKDLATALKLPVILVVANRLGCLNHALLSIAAIQNSGLSLEAIIINDTEASDYNYANDLEKWCELPLYRHPFNG